MQGTAIIPKCGMCKRELTAGRCYGPGCKNNQLAWQAAAFRALQRGQAKGHARKVAAGVLS